MVTVWLFFYLQKTLQSSRNKKLKAQESSKERLDGPAVCVLGVRLRKLSNVLIGQS
jgi:hypothetical protein